MSEEKVDPLTALEEKRAARKAARQKDYDARALIDLEHLDQLEQEHGDSCVTYLKIDRDGLPTMAIARCPSAFEVKRFRAAVMPKGDKDKPDPVPAAEQVATSCLLYPEREVFDQMCQVVPSLRQQLGAAALELATGKTKAEGKD